MKPPDVLFEYEGWAIIPAGHRRFTDDQSYEVRCKCALITGCLTTPKEAAPEGFVEVCCSRCGTLMTTKASGVLAATLRILEKLG